MWEKTSEQYFAICGLVFACFALPLSRPYPISGPDPWEFFQIFLVFNIEKVSRLGEFFAFSGRIFEYFAQPLRTVCSISGAHPWEFFQNFPNFRYL